MNFSLKSIPLTMLAMALCLSLPACGGDDDDDDVDCSDIGEKGTCDGTVAKYCIAKTLLSDDCAKMDMFCEMDPEDGAVCTNSIEQKGACGTITEKGICEGNIWKYCDTSSEDGVGTLVTTNCVATEQVCDPYGFMGSARCAEEREHFDWEGKSCAAYDIENNSNACLDNAIVVCTDDTLWLGELCEAPTTCQATESVYVNYECK